MHAAAKLPLATWLADQPNYGGLGQRLTIPEMPSVAKRAASSEVIPRCCHGACSHNVVCDCLSEGNLRGRMMKRCCNSSSLTTREGPLRRSASVERTSIGKHGARIKEVPALRLWQLRETPVPLCDAGSFEVLLEDFLPMTTDALATNTARAR